MKKLLFLMSLILATNLSAAGRPWMAREIVVPAPAAVSDEEKRQVREATRHRSEATLRQIRSWDAGAPPYRWNEIAFRAISTSDAQQERAIALLHLAMHDAIVLATTAKDRFPRKPPDRTLSDLRTAADPLPNSYPSEHAAAAGAANVVLSYLIPERTAEWKRLAEEAGQSRIAAGVSWPSDVAAGLLVGRAVGDQIVAYAKRDGSDKAWTGSVPTTPGKWNGKNPAEPQIAEWKPIILTSPKQFRPAAPPDFGEKEMAEVRDPALNISPNRRAAYKWAITSIQQHWNDKASLLIFENKIDRDPADAARIYALLNTAYYDALVANWDAKYAYWGPRPVQVDPSFKSLIPTPNFPGYPSGHATFAGLGATVLASFFPDRAAEFNATAEEMASSRLWGGIHFRVDNEVGLELGRAVGRAAIAWDRERH